MTYALCILPRTEKELSTLDSKPYESIKKNIYGLRDEPRPPGCRKLADSPGWRIWVGDYRVVYGIDDAARTVTVLRVSHRKEIYR